MARYLATFLAGGTLIAVPLACNFILCACFIPSYAPDVFDRMHIPMRTSELFGDLFYSTPVLCVILRTGADFILCGARSAVVLGLSCIVRNRIALIAAPYIFLLLTKHVGQQVYIALRNSGFEHFGYNIALFDQLRGAPDAFFCPGLVAGICLAVMIAVSVVLPMLTSQQDIL